MKVIKRNGTEAVFDEDKIVKAVEKANNGGDAPELSQSQINEIADYISYKCQKMGRAVSVEEIQDMVENQIMATGAFEVARRYVRYRYKRTLVRKANTTDSRILTLIEGNNEELLQENSNKAVSYTHLDVYKRQSLSYGFHNIAKSGRMLPFYVDINNDTDEDIEGKLVIEVQGSTETDINKFENAAVYYSFNVYLPKNQLTKLKNTISISESGSGAKLTL